MLFGYRLAAKLGITDVDGLIDSMTDEQWVSWYAVSIIDGWNHGWAQTGEILASIHNLGNRVEISASSKPSETHRNSKWLSGFEIVKKLTTFGKQKRTKAKDLAKLLEARENRKKRHG